MMHSSLIASRGDIGGESGASVASVTVPASWVSSASMRKSKRRAADFDLQFRQRQVGAIRTGFAMHMLGGGEGAARLEALAAGAGNTISKRPESSTIFSTLRAF